MVVSPFQTNLFDIIAGYTFDNNSPVPIGAEFTCSGTDQHLLLQRRDTSKDAYTSSVSDSMNIGKSSQLGMHGFDSLNNFT